MPDAGILLDSDEIEVACDLLWFVRREDGSSATVEALFSRLQAVRAGDLGGGATADVDEDEARAIVSAGLSAAGRVPVDAGEAALVDRLARETGGSPS